MKAITPGKARTVKITLLGGTEGRNSRSQMANGRSEGSEPKRNTRARRGKGPHAVEFLSPASAPHGEPGLGREANRRELATCADPSCVELVRCRTPFERAHNIRVYDREARVELLQPNCYGKGSNLVPNQHSVPRLYPRGELTSPGPDGRGGYQSCDAVCDETEMRRRRMAHALGDQRQSIEGPGPGNRAADQLHLLGPKLARAVCVSGGAYISERRGGQDAQYQ